MSKKVYRLQQLLDERFEEKADTLGLQLTAGWLNGNDKTNHITAAQIKQFAALENETPGAHLTHVQISLLCQLFGLSDAKYFYTDYFEKVAIDTLKQDLRTGNVGPFTDKIHTT